MFKLTIVNGDKGMLEIFLLGCLDTDPDPWGPSVKPIGFKKASLQQSCQLKEGEQYVKIPMSSVRYVR